MAGDSSSEEDDEWLFSSIEKYSILHMYTLQQPALLLSVLESNNICVCTSTGHDSKELQELKIPLKLLSSQEDGLARERDLVMVGGAFCNESTSHLRPVGDGSNQVITLARGGKVVTLWQLGESSAENDVIKTVADIVIPKRANSTTGDLMSNVVNNMAAICSPQGNMIFMINITEKSIMQLDTTDEASPVIQEDLNTLYLLTSNSNSIVLTTVSCYGKVFAGYVADYKNISNDFKWTEVWQAKSHKFASCLDHSTIYMVSERGEVLAGNVISTNPGIYVKKKEYSLNLERRNQKAFDAVGKGLCCCCFTADNGLYMSVAGLDTNVYVYHVMEEAKGIQTPIFIHTSHTHEVTSHHWLSISKPLILSTSNDASLHIWRWADKKKDLDEK